MPNQPEQGTFDLGDKQRPNPSSDPDTFDGVRRTIAGGRHRVRPNPTDPLLKGAVEIQEEPKKKELPPYTHTIPNGRDVWFPEDDPGKGVTSTKSMGTLHVAATGDTALVRGERGRKPRYILTEMGATQRPDGPIIDRLPGEVLVTSYAIARKPIGMRQPPSAPLEQR